MAYVTHRKPARPVWESAVLLLHGAHVNHVVPVLRKFWRQAVGKA